MCEVFYRQLKEGIPFTGYQNCLLIGPNARAKRVLHTLGKKYFAE